MTSLIGGSSPCRFRNTAIRRIQFASGARSGPSQSQCRTASFATPVSRTVRKDTGMRVVLIYSCRDVALSMTGKPGNYIHWHEACGGLSPLFAPKKFPPCLCTHRAACCSTRALNAPDTLRGKISGYSHTPKQSERFPSMLARNPA